MGLESCLQAIEAQQPKERSDVWMCGEQLKDMCRAEPGLCELVERDLGKKGMALSDCAKQIKQFADGHRTGNFACVTPVEAERIIRTFYGLPERGHRAAPETPPKLVQLEDFF